MPKLIFLGSSNAVPDELHENTHMVLVGDNRTVLVDCVDGTFLRLKSVDIDPLLLNDLILTHFHPDHVSGVPQLLMNMWLTGRTLPLHVHGLDYTIDRMERVLDLYGLFGWPNFFPVTFTRLPSQEMIPVLEDEELRIVSSPVKHLIPNIGLRFESLKSRKTLAYSGDTEPCPQVIRLAGGVDILVHEASGPTPGHSSARQAGQAAAQASVGELFLVHYPTGQFAAGDLVSDARAAFTGPVTLVEDLDSLDLN
jgi:ribonuclease Z